MQILPTASFKKIITSVRSSPAKVSATTTQNFDDLSPTEKAAAIAKLEEVVAPWEKKRKFNWKIFAMVFFGLTLTAAIALAATAIAMDKDKDPALVAKLRMANTNLDRMALLPDDSDWLFDFTKQDKYTFAPGGVVNANAATFPATIGNGLTMAMLNLGPCSMLPPHIHPRAANYVVAVSGTTMTYMIAENGARTVTEQLTPGKMTIFPSASVHTMMNIGCENAQLVSALNNEDTGTTNLANSLFSLPSDMINAVVGNSININATENQVPPPGTGSVWGPDACRARCAAQGKMIKRSY